MNPQDSKTLPLLPLQIQVNAMMQSVKSYECHSVTKIVWARWETDTSKGCAQHARPQISSAKQDNQANQTNQVTSRRDHRLSTCKNFTRVVAIGRVS